MELEQIKREGELQAVFQHIHNLLWDAKRDLEEASKTNGRRYMFFKERVTKAKKAIAGAEEAYLALNKMMRSK